MSRRRRRYFIGRLTPIYARRRIDADLPPPDGDPTYAVTLKWSELVPLPVNGDSVAIPSNTHLILDVPTPALAHLDIAGKFSPDPAALSLAVTADSIAVTGTNGHWQIGTEATPWLKPYVITLTGAKPASGSLTASTARQIAVNGGRLDWWGDVSRVHRTRLAADAAAGATVMMIDTASSNWEAGDDIAIGPTDFHAVSGRTQRLVLQSVSGFGITTTAGLTYSKFGRMQYVNDDGLSFTNGTYTPDPTWAADEIPPRELDERAIVTNLTRNIVIQAPNDTAWSVDGWGVDVMVMGQADLMKDRIKVSGVRIVRCGKRGVLGKYPFHWHMLSYSSYNAADPVNSGKDYYGLVEGNFIRDCVIDDSANRAVVVHGTNGVDVDRNVAVSIRGHAFFLENGSEMWNRLRDNVALLMNDPHPGVSENSLQFNADGSAAGGVRLAFHEATNRVAGFWITNPKNTITGNWSCDSVGNGIWFAFSPKTFGPSRNALMPPALGFPIKPYRINHLLIDNNYASSCYSHGALTDTPVNDEAGRLYGHAHEPKQGDNDGTPSVMYAIERMTIVKCGRPTSGGAYVNRVFQIDYRHWFVADNQAEGIHGSAGGRILAVTFMGRTLNTPTVANTYPRVGVQTYHYSVGQVNCQYVNLPFAPGRNAPANDDRDVGGGANSLIDLYLEPVEVGTILSKGAKFINSHPGYRNKPPWLRGRGENFTFAGALWDPYGYWGGPAGSYIVYGNYAPQNAFFTHGLTDAVAHTPSGMGTVHTMTRFIGIQSFRTEQNPSLYLPYMPLHVYRLDDSLNVVGEWHVNDGRGGGTLPAFRHFAAANGGIYRWAYPYSDSTPQQPSVWSAFTVQCGFRVDDRVVLGVPWGGATAKVFTRAKNSLPESSGVPYMDSWATVAITNGEARLANVAASSVAEVIDPVGNADCSKVFVDTAAKLCWFRFKGGLKYLGSENFPNTVPFAGGGFVTAYLEQFKQPYRVYILPA